ncbi:AraC family transcriptional regulator [Nostoc sp. PA-18-2419]|uniref:AraC family transcriptional regulator n=1 Tax=Nostoc sp. PA-18-2419 TaxID=2575443 RepID=UPI001109D80E|nr:AraC family transcriptional regulator [Nostoc sp. PA-18-2419]
MTVTLTEKEEWELWAEANHNSPQQLEQEPFTILHKVPNQFGKGYVQQIEVHPHLWLEIWDYEYHDDVLCKMPECNHLVQFSVLLCGKVIDEYGGQVGEGYTMISGSGVQRQMLVEYPKSRYVGVNIHMSPSLLATFFPNEVWKIPHQLSLLAKGNDWQTLLYPETTMAIGGITQQIVNCPYQEMTKRIYLQAKVLELMALQLAPILANRYGLQPSPRLKAETIARIHYAKDILLAHLENPPSLLELAQIVGVSDRTLQRGFRELFGKTAFSYLTEKRMESAEQLLRQGNITIAEVAHRVGYSEPRRFAEAFRRRFGITPSGCLLGKKSVSGT